MTRYVVNVEVSLDADDEETALAEAESAARATWGARAEVIECEDMTDYPPGARPL